MTTRRVVQTLRGPAWYQATGTTATQWALVQDAMRRCDSPGLHLVEHRQRQPKNRSRAEQRKPKIDHRQPHGVRFHAALAELRKAIWADDVELANLLSDQLDAIADAWEHKELGETNHGRERQPLP